MQVKVFDLKGVEIGKMSLNEKVFGAEKNEALVHQVIVATLNNARQGTKSTLTRAEVRGGGKKPWKQKGTGHARQGSIRAPQWIKGGVVFAPKPRDFSQKVNKQMKKLAFISAISSAVKDKDLIVVDSLNINEAKTATVANALKALGVNKSCVLVTSADNGNLYLASRNLPKVEVSTANLLSTYQIVSSNKIVIEKDAIKVIEEAYKD